MKDIDPEPKCQTKEGSIAVSTIEIVKYGPIEIHLTQSRKVAKVKLILRAFASLRDNSAVYI